MRLLLCAALLCSAPAAAQVNVETMAARADHEGFGGLSKIDFGRTSGNVDTLYVKGEAEGHYLRLRDDPPDDSRMWFRDRIVLASHYALKTYKGERADNEGFLHLRYTRMVVPRLGFDVFGQVQFDEFHLLERRDVGGLDARLDAVHTTPFELWLGAGYMIEHELRTVEAPDAAEVYNHRIATYFSFDLRVIPDVMTLLGTTCYQPLAGDLSDVQIFSEWYMDFHITKKFSMGPDLLIRYDSQPPGDLYKMDYGIYNNLTLKI